MIQHNNDSCNFHLWPHGHKNPTAPSLCQVTQWGVKKNPWPHSGMRHHHSTVLQLPARPFPPEHGWSWHSHGWLFPQLPRVFESYLVRYEIWIPNSSKALVVLWGVNPYRFFQTKGMTGGFFPWKTRVRYCVCLCVFFWVGRTPPKKKTIGLLESPKLWCA